MTFVRLAGCNAPDLGLGCVRWCDTKDSWPARAGEDVDVEAVVERVNYPRLCLTGGEPLLQLEGVAALLDAAHARGIRVHVETNGTIGPELPPAGGWRRGGAAPARRRPRALRRRPGGRSATQLPAWTSTGWW